MPLRIRCSKGCGKDVVISDEVIEEAKQLGAPIVAAHENCEQSSVQFRKFRTEIRVFEILQNDTEIELARVGGTVEAVSFSAAFDSLSRDISKRWQRVGEMAHMIDSEVPTT